ncbi:unnamed protein product [Bursaphelenchus xylophilus]|uniref:(pine wood nematode) hypothetical protein n=1 Tax=Bursaphelenchus xylophilus TaxID=6326 RepID=A0A1I7SWS0_BURXY|nr:unnamed protein product [Bursaphelenchus xylophilus]CAG9099853.1 unnamed protein product [Bursaphelenchus xylophilus]
MRSLLHWVGCLGILAVGGNAKKCLTTTPLTVSGECGEHEVTFQTTVEKNRVAVRINPGEKSESTFTNVTKLFLNVAGCEVELAIVPGLFLTAQNSHSFSAPLDGLLVIVEQTGNYSLFSASTGLQRFYKCPSKQVYFDDYGTQKTARVSVRLTKKEPSLKLEFVESKLWTVSSVRRLSVLSITFILTVFSLLM